jgi:Putative beta-barrel porin 2
LRTWLASGVLALCAATVTGAAEPAPPSKPPGLLHWGPVYLTPRLRIGTLGLDTNVFYTATDRQTDFTASGGPGLEIVLPVRSSVRLTVEGGIDYVYFLRTTSQRRLAGDARARLDLVGARADAALEGSYRRMFGRPSFEVDERIVQDQEQARVDGHAELSERFALRANVIATRLDIPEAAEFAGTDLRRTLTHDTYLGRLILETALTPKTSLLLYGDYEADRFPLDAGRDADSNRAAIGFEIASSTRLSGTLLVGARSFRLQSGGDPGEPSDLVEPYADVNLVYRFGPRTRLIATYNQDLYYSAFQPVTGLPVIHQQTYRLRLEKGLVGALDLQLYGGLTKLRSDGLIRVEVEPGETVLAVRDDDAWEGGADLGYTFRRHLRIGIAASYVDRRSTIDDFGIDGLLVGGTITFTP